MGELSITEYRLKLARALTRVETPQLRGFFGREFAEQIMLHHHCRDGTLVYDYPRIQFKILERQAVLIGLEEGSELLARLWLEVDQARIGAEDLEVREATIQRRREAFGGSEKRVGYRLLSPWLALNQENIRRYHASRHEEQRRALLEQILIGNCLAFAKSFRHKVNIRLRADCSRLRPVRARLKGVAMQGFLGAFSINFLLPDSVGIGKSVSRGFGTVLKVQLKN